MATLGKEGRVIPLVPWRLFLLQVAGGPRYARQKPLQHASTHCIANARIDHPVRDAAHIPDVVWNHALQPEHLVYGQAAPVAGHIEATGACARTCQGHATVRLPLAELFTGVHVRKDCSLVRLVPCQL